MSKAARGTKRVCEGCGSKFYDLNKEPIICPLCETEFKLAKPAANAKPEEVEEVVEPVKPPKAEEKEGADSEELTADPELAAVDDDELADLEVETDDSDDSEDDAFLPEADEGDDDVSGLLGDSIPKVDDES